MSRFAKDPDKGIERRSWNAREYAKKARQRQQIEARERFEREMARLPGQATTELRDASGRRHVPELHRKIGTTRAVNLGSDDKADQGGFYCKVCDYVAKDSFTWLEHQNSVQHLSKAGIQSKVPVATTDEVRERLAKLRRRKMQQKQRRKGGMAVDSDDEDAQRKDERLAEKLRLAREKEEEKRRRKQQDEWRQTTFDLQLQHEQALERAEEEGVWHGPAPLPPNGADSDYVVPRVPPGLGLEDPSDEIKQRIAERKKERNRVPNDETETAETAEEVETTTSTTTTQSSEQSSKQKEQEQPQSPGAEDDESMMMAALGFASFGGSRKQ
ncbi:MAG: hypothetical protein MHM6MM_002023 [Cercozoa sp. M6MM]